MTSNGLRCAHPPAGSPHLFALFQAALTRRLHCARCVRYRRAMADLTPVIETMEHRWMRAWVNGDTRALKGATARDFILLTASKPPAILDRPSWLEAAAKRWHCSSYRFGDILVRGGGKTALFTAAVEIKATMDGRDWSGTFWITDLWRRGRVRRGWKLVQRTISRPDDNPDLPKAIRSLQLWK